MIAPDARDLEEHRLFGMRVVVDELRGEVRYDEGVHEHKESESDKRELHQRGRRGNPHQGRIAAMRADHGDDHLRQRDGERENEREMTKLQNHG